MSFHVDQTEVIGKRLNAAASPVFWLLFVLPVLLIPGAAYVFYTYDRGEALASIAMEQENLVAQGAADLRRFVLRAMSDADFLSKLPSVQSFGASGSAGQKPRIGADLLAFQQSHANDYFQVRLLSLAGRELVRVGMVDGHPRVTQERLLQDKSGHDYLNDGRALPNGGFHLSRFDLNVENGQVEQPIRPVIRMVHRFNSADGTPLLLVLNIEGAWFLRQLHANSEDGRIPLMLIDGQGCVLPQGGSLQDWDCVQQGTAETGFAAAHPKVWRAITQGYEVPDTGLLAHSDLNTLLQPNLVESGGNMRMRNNLLAVSYVEHDSLNALMAPLRKIYSTYAAIALTALLAGWLAWWMFVLKRRAMLAASAENMERITGLENAVSNQSQQLQENAQNIGSVGIIAAGIAHDLNNLLGIIQGYSDLVCAELGEKSAAARNMRLVKVAVNRGKNLVRQVIMLAGDKDGPTSSHVPMLELLKEVIDLLSVRAGADISIDLQAEDPGDALVWGDAGQLHQIFLNLGINAIQALQPGPGTIGFTLDSVDSLPDGSATKPGKAKRYLRIQVADNGPGMSKDVASRVFEANFTTKQESGGNGLGLAVVRSATERHGGTIDLTTAPGEGTRFTVCLPLATAAQQIASPVEDRRKITSDMRIVLVVDDDRHYLEIYSKSLQSNGFSIVCMDNPWDALKVVFTGEDAIAAVVTDYDMPGLDGFDLARRLRQFRPGLPVVICTGREVESLQQTAADQGISGVFSKPVDFAQLQNHLDVIIRDHE